LLGTIATEEYLAKNTLFVWNTDVMPRVLIQRGKSSSRLSLPAKYRKKYKTVSSLTGMDVCHEEDTTGIFNDLEEKGYEGLQLY
jgi:hypothetical protein